MQRAGNDRTLVMSNYIALLMFIKKFLVLRQQLEN
jgi:hypothetical protein